MLLPTSVPTGSYCSRARSRIGVYAYACRSQRPHSQKNSNLRFMLRIFAPFLFFHRLWKVHRMAWKKRGVRLLLTVTAPQVVHAPGIPGPCHVPEYGYVVHFQRGPSRRGTHRISHGPCKPNSDLLQRDQQKTHPIADGARSEVEWFDKCDGPTADRIMEEKCNARQKYFNWTTLG